MKKEAKALLKTKFSGVQLSEARQESIATRAAAKATTVEELDAVLDELNEAYPFADIAKEDDRLRSLEAEVKKKVEPPKEEQEKKVEEEESKDGDSAVLVLLKEMRAEIQTIKAEKATTSYKDRATKSLNLNSLDEEIRNSVLEDIEDRTFTDDDHFDKYIERQSKLLGTAVQNATDGQFGNDIPVGGVRTPPGKVVEATDKELDAAISNLKI